MRTFPLRRSVLESLLVNARSPRASPLHTLMNVNSHTHTNIYTRVHIHTNMTSRYVCVWLSRLREHDFVSSFLPGFPCLANLLFVAVSGCCVNRSHTGFERQTHCLYCHLWLGVVHPCRKSAVKPGACILLRSRADKYHSFHNYDHVSAIPMQTRHTESQSRYLSLSNGNDRIWS